MIVTPDCAEKSNDAMQVSYHELETFNGASSSVVVAEPSFPLETLQPGRNYSIAVSALSNGIASVPTTVFQATSKFSSVQEST